MTLRPVAAVVLAVAAVPAMLAARAQTAPTFKAAIDAVRVDVLVTDAGHPVMGLGPDDFDIRDNGVPQRPDLVIFEQLPLNVVLALDTSGSVSGEVLGHLRAAGRTLIDALQSTDQMALVTFSRRVSIRMPLTHDASLVRAALDRDAESGDTALVDAVHTALLVGEADTGRALVVVFSDGADTASFLTPESVLANVRSSDAVLYAVTTALKTPFLKDVTDMTGGRVLNIDSMTRLGEALTAIVAEFRHRYVVSYTPAGARTPGWHRLDVRVKNRRAAVRARPGYLRQG